MNPFWPGPGARRAAAALGVAAVTAVVWAAAAVPPAHALPVIPSRNLTVVAQFNDFPPAAGAQFGSGYACCWHYVHEDGREYAVIGYRRGIAIYNVTNPLAVTFVDSIPGPSNSWRELKSYRNWIYVVSEAFGAGAGLQIVRMTDPEDPVLVGTYTTTFLAAHTVTIDTTRALLFANGTRLSSGQAAGMRILSLASPEAPVEVGRWPIQALPIPSDKYVHDSVLRGTTLYAASIYAGTMRVVDTSNPAAAFETASFTYPDAHYCHNSWPDASGQYLYVTDETNGMPLGIFDISSYPTSFKYPVYEWTSNTQAIVHNAHVNGDDLVLANYTEGVRMLDASDPRHPAEFGYADTFSGPSGGYKGVWGVDPYLPSGLVIASDMQTGLWVFTVQRDYGLVRVEVTDAATTLPMDSTMVYCTTQGDSAHTALDGDGIVAFAPAAGTHTFQVKCWGYETATQTVSVAQGSSQTIQVALVRKPTADLTGVVRDVTNQALLAEAEVNLEYTPVHEHTDGSGAYALTEVPDDTYFVTVHRPGYTPFKFDRRIGPGFGGVQDLQLQPGVAWDNLSSGSGWSVTPAANESHVQSSGMWTRVDPYGTPVNVGGGETEAPRPPDAGEEPFAWRTGPLSRDNPGVVPLHEDHEGSGATPGQVQTSSDRSPAPDSMCFVTGNNPALPASVIDGADVDSTTSLTSAVYDLTGMTTPMIGAWMWFYSQFRHPDDYLAVLISNNNGASWVPVDTLRGIRNHWTEHDYAVADYVTPTNQVRLRFVAVDGGEPSVVEAAVDDVIAYDAAIGPVGILDGDARIVLRFEAVWPNPARGDVRFVLAVPEAGDVEVDVIDIAGRRVRSLHRGAASRGTLTLHWDGESDHGRASAAGLYFIRARTPEATTHARFVRVN